MKLKKHHLIKAIALSVFTILPTISIAQTPCESVQKKASQKSTNQAALAAVNAVCKRMQEDATEKNMPLEDYAKTLAQNPRSIATYKSIAEQNLRLNELNESNNELNNELSKEHCMSLCQTAVVVAVTLPIGGLILAEQLLKDYQNNKCQAVTNQSCQI